MRNANRIVLLLGIVLLVAPVAAQDSANNVFFGPQTFERTTGTVDVYEEEFDLPSTGVFLLLLHNGDAEGSRVDAATIEVNGLAVISPSDLDEQVADVRRRVELSAGTNRIRVELMGDPGAFVTLAVVHPDHPPLFVQGRLVLPWGRNDASQALAVALKNGSVRFPRAFRVLFFRPDGQVSAASPRLVLPPRGSAVLGLEQLLAGADWSAGSIEIYYAGPGVARIHGSARHLNLLLGDFEIEPLQQAGFRVQRSRVNTATDVTARAPRR